MVRGRHALVMAGCCMLGSCGEQDLYSGLSQAEATQMAALGASSGVPITTRSPDGKTWSVAVPAGRTADAVGLLTRHGLPAVQRPSLGDIFKKEGFVSSPTEEHARLIYGLSQQLETTLSAIDGVTEAKVMLSIPPRDPLADVQPAPSAAVLLRYDADRGLRVSAGSIKALVASSFEGMTYDHVSLVMLPHQLIQATPVAPSIDRGVTLRDSLVGIAVMLLAGAIGWFVYCRRLPKVVA